MTGSSERKTVIPRRAFLPPNQTEEDELRQIFSREIERMKANHEKLRRDAIKKIIFIAIILTVAIAYEIYVVPELIKGL